MMKFFILWTAACIAPLTASMAADLHSDTFQDGASTLGWINGAGTTSLIADGGPNGVGDSYLRVDPNINLAVHNSSAEWVGDYSAINAARITADLMAPVTSTPLEIRVVLFGPTTFSDRWTSTVAQTVPNDGVWRSYTFPLGPSDLTAVSTFTPSTYSQLMSSVLQVMFRHDPGGPDSGGTSTTGVLNMDNITLAAAPAPPPGDFNGDGRVDGGDLNDPTNGWKARFGSDLGGNDFLTWQRNLGAAATATAVAAVPEPAGLLMAAVAFALMACSTARYPRKARANQAS
jgi:hypothetical protein